MEPPSQRVIDQVQKLSGRYPNSTVYIMVVVTIILILQIVTIFTGG